MKFVDIHTHILYGVDDGASTLEQSLAILEVAKKYDVYGICFTPHCFITNKLNIQEIKQKTEKIKLQSKSDINIFYGGEMMIENTLPTFMKENSDFCLGEGKYVLIELPMFNYPIYIKEVLFQLKANGFIPIIAHPERNASIQLETMKYIKDILTNGYLQINGGSLTGKYGRLAKKTALKLIDNDLVSFVASDSHDDKGYKLLDKAYDIYVKLKGKEKADEVFFYNPYRALKGEYIEQVEMV